MKEEKRERGCKGEARCNREELERVIWAVGGSLSCSQAVDGFVATSKSERIGRFLPTPYTSLDNLNRGLRGQVSRRIHNLQKELSDLGYTVRLASSLICEVLGSSLLYL